MKTFTYEDMNGNRAKFEYTQDKRGAFSRVYLGVDYVMSVTNSMDKEALQFCSGQHIPVAEHVGFKKCDSRVYMMPRYHYATGRALAQVKILSKTISTITRPKHRHDAYSFNMRFLDAIEADTRIDRTIVGDIEHMINAYANYGAQYMIEIAKRNIMQDDTGNLILLDIFFDIEEMRTQVFMRIAL